MALPSQTRILQTLGYSFVHIRNNQYLFPTGLTAEELAYADDLASKIAAIDIELLENTRDSMAVKVQDLGLDYNRYISQTLGMKERLLDRLSDAIGVCRNEKAEEGYNLSVRNYY